MDFIDATGSGDVDVSCVRTTNSCTGRTIKGLCGDLVNIPDKWCNPTGKWHVGVKNKYDFIPSVVKSRDQVC